MKKTILLFCICSLTRMVNAQITLQSGNVAQSPTYNANMRFQAGVRSAPIPASGTNLTWDYSRLNANFSKVDIYRPATRSGFTSYSRYLSENTFVGDVPLPSEYYYHLTGDGLFEVGSYQAAQTLGLVNFGNNADSIVFPGANVIFKTPAPILKFPCTYGHSWTANHIYNTPFKLSVASFSLSNAQALWVQRVYKSDSVVGWGKLILPTLSGPSNPVEVLLIKTSRYLVDSYYINGSPAPGGLLSGLNVRQNDTNHFNTYTFHAAGAELPLLQILLDASWTVFGFTYYTNGIFPLASAATTMPAMQIYPNPVKAGQLLHLDLNASVSDIVVTLVDLQGRTMFTWNGHNVAAAKGIQIPAWLSPGNYLCRVSGKDGDIHTGKITVE